MRVAVVTGAGSGIGRATAERLGRRGLAVAVAGRRPAPLAETVAAVEAAGGEGLAVPVDLADADAGERLVAAVLDRYGRLDVVVNNAATIRHRPLGEWDVTGFDGHVAVNVRSPYFLIQAALPALRRGEAPAVVNVSSSSGTLVRPTQSVYGMTKAALEYLTRALAAELAPDGIRVNAVAPGPVDTPIHAQWSDDLEATYAWLADQVPLGRIGVADDVARWIEILTDEETAWVTGAVIPVDGGQVLDRA